MVSLQDIAENSSVFKIPDNGVYIEYMVPQTVLPREGFSVCGSVICQFQNSQTLDTWIAIRHEMVNMLQSIAGIEDSLEIVPIERFDDVSLIQERPFNEGYTSRSYSEYLRYGTSKPNEWIVKELSQLRIKTLVIDTFDHDELVESDFETSDQIIANVIHRTLLKPNRNLVWKEPWAVYLPAIEKIHLECWSNSHSPTQVD